MLNVFLKVRSEVTRDNFVGLRKPDACQLAHISSNLTIKESKAHAEDLLSTLDDVLNVSCTGPLS